MRPRICLVAPASLLFATLTAEALQPTDAVRRAIEATGASAGLCVHVGTTDGRLETKLTDSDRLLVHGLASNDAATETARRTIRAAGLYGLASVEKARALNALPYADNLVNLLVADLDALRSKAPPREEILRVLAPNGTACLKTGGKWTQVRKPRPNEMDEWTHFDYGPEGNGVSHDRLVRPPTRLQWAAGVQPIKLGGNPAGFHTYTAPRAAGGRIFIEWGRRDKNNKRRTWYNARDAFNGLPLWTLENTARGRKDWQFVAVGDRLYTFTENEGSLVALDAATGNVVKTYTQAGRHNDERGRTALRYCSGTLILTVNNTLYALDATSGDLKWKHRENGGLFFPSASANAGKVFVAVAPEKVLRISGRWPVAELEAILCLDLATGKQVWRNTEVAGGHIGQLVYSDGDLALFGSGAIGGGEKPYIGNIRVRDGKLLWHATFKTAYNRFGYNMLVRDGTLYYADAWRIYAHNLQTGEASVPFDDRGYNMRCNRFSATDNLFIYGLVAYVDKTWHGRFLSITRSGCAQGAVPANGMLYFTPNACRCITQLRGHICLSAEPLREPVPDRERLARGSGKPDEAVPAPPTTDVPPGPIAEDWLRQARAPVIETEPVSAGGKTFVAVIHRHRLEARDAAGKTLWSFTAGGRISSPPVIHNGLCLFGSHDGWAYCLRESDGTLLWRFMAAPYERKIVAHGQLESSWPVYGVVMHNGLVCLSAGLHPETGGGIYIYGLEPTSGKLAWKKVLRRSPIIHDGKSRIKIHPNRILNDALKTDGNSLSLPGITFRPDEPDAEIQQKVDGLDDGKKKHAMLRILR